MALTKQSNISKPLLTWYDQQGRKHLPWREKISPYRVWISEIMLQQTQVKTVIPYFERFISRFPTVSALANAPEDEVLHLWTGLGYYARARNLHHAAKQIVAGNNEEFPDTLEKLELLRGIGRSTAGAILAIAFNQKGIILDGNVKRVLSRFYMTETPTWELAEKNTPNKRAGDYAQAIMDLGATICTRSKPLCHVCPVATNCQAYLQNKQTDYPIKKPKKIIPTRAIQVLIFHNTKRQEILLEKRPPVGIWGGLWSFPECPIDVDVKQWCEENLNCHINEMHSWATFKHVFTHFQLNITPVYIPSYQLKNCVMDAQQQIWYKLNKPTARGFSSPVKGLGQHLSEMDHVT